MDRIIGFRLVLETLNLQIYNRSRIDVFVSLVALEMTGFVIQKNGK